MIDTLLAPSWQSRSFRDLVCAKGFYLRAIGCNTLSPAPYTGLGMVAHIEGEVDLCIQRYHQVQSVLSVIPYSWSLTMRHNAGSGSSTSGPRFNRFT